MYDIEAIHNPVVKAMALTLNGHMELVLEGGMHPADAALRILGSSRKAVDQYLAKGEVEDAEDTRPTPT